MHNLDIDCLTEINPAAEAGSAVEGNGGEGISLVGVWGQSLPGRGDSRCKGLRWKRARGCGGHCGADRVGRGGHCKGSGFCSERGGKALESRGWAAMTGFMSQQHYSSSRVRIDYVIETGKLRENVSCAADHVSDLLNKIHFT